MSKLLKIILGILGAIVLIVVLAIGAFALFFNPNDYRDRITQEAKKATGRDLTLGDIKVSIYPVLGAAIKNVKVSNAQGFGDAPFAVIAEADVGVQLLPLLLRREAKVGSVNLSGLQLNVVKNADGKTNYDDLTQKKSGAAPATPEAPASGGGAGIKSIDIGSVSIKNAAISYTDNQAKSAYSLNKLNLKTGSIKPGKPFDFALDFATSVTRPAVNANISVASTLALDLEKQIFKADKLKLKVKAALPEMKADIEVGSSISADLGTKIYKAEKLAGSVAVEGKSIPGTKEKADFNGDAIYDGAKGTVKIASLDLLAAGLKATVALDGSGLNGKTPRFTGPLSVKPFNPRDLLSLLGTKVETADPAVLKEMTIKAKLDATTNSARFNDLVIKLDQSTVSGNAGIANLSTQAAEFALKLDTIDADRYLSPKSAAQAPAAAPATPAEKAKAENEPLPIDALDGFNANGTIDIAKLKLSGVSMANVRLKLDAAKGQPKHIDLAANLYGGSMTTSTRVTPGARPTFAESLKLVSIAAGPLLKDFTGKESMTGEGNVSMDVTSAGKTMGEVKRALNGDVAFDFQNGAVKGFNLGQLIRKGEAFMKGQQLNETEPQQTDFTTLAAKAHITNGVLQSDMLDAKSPLFRVDGAGQADLVKETIDYTIKPTIVNTAAGQGGKNLADLSGIVIPVRVTGPWSAPKYSLDVKAALQQQATEKLRGKANDFIDKKLDGKLGDSPLKDRLKEGLGSFFGKKKKEEPPPPPAPAPAPATR